MAKSTSKDMTVGSPTRLILTFMVPVLFGLVFQQVYNIVDTMIVGKYLGVTPLAAVGATGSINFLIIGFCLGTCAGFALPVAQMFGAKDFVALKKYVGNSVLLSVAFAAVTTLITTALCRNILQWMKTPSDIIDMSFDYIFVIFAGIPFIVLYNLLASFIRAIGDARTPLYFLIICSFLNIGLDLLFVVRYGMGVKGAALATVIAQAVSGILCLILVARRFELLHITRRDLRPELYYLLNLARMGFPMGLQYSVTAIGSIILQTNLNTLGSVFVAANTASVRLNGIMMSPTDALAQTLSTYCGQNVGAKKLNRIKKGLLSAQVMGLIYSVAALIATIFLGRYMIMAFVDPSETEVIGYAYRLLITNLSFYYPLVIINTVRPSIQSMGFPGFSIFSGLSEMIARGVVGAVFIPRFGFAAACFASPAAWLLADAFLIPAYFYCMRKLRERMPGNG